MNDTTTLTGEVNYDDTLVSEDVPALFGTAAPDAATVAGARRNWLARFDAEIYGTMPPPPDAVTIERIPIANENAERIAITLDVAGRHFSVDAALWLPKTAGQTPVPIVLGLDFLGPVGIFVTDAYPIDPHARIPSSSGRRLSDSLRGTTAHRWPVKLITEAGFAVLTSCYGSWVPDSEDVWRDHGVWPLTQPAAETTTPGALSLWAWSISRLIDVAALLPEIDTTRIAVAGHSRLGKAALLAAAHDTRIGAALVNDSGCMGASLTSRVYGETKPEMRMRFPHWLPEDPRPAAPDALPLDQHHLLASVAPRGLYVASASEDLWADPKGEYLAFVAAAPMWPEASPPPLNAIWHENAQYTGGGIGWHLRPGPHDIRPYDWRRFLVFAADRLTNRA